MRIALFSGNYNYIREGANQALNRLVAFAESEGHKFRVYSPVTDTPAFEPSGDLVPVPSMALPVRGEFRLAPWLPRSIREDVQTFAPDIIHVSTPDILGTRAQSLAKRLHIPIIASLHTRFETYLSFYGLDWIRPLAEAHLRRFYKRSDHVLAPTPGLVDEMKAMRRDRQASLWSRGIDRDLFNPDRRDDGWRKAQGWETDDVVLLFFGRLVLEKGVRDFIEIIDRVQAKGLRARPLVVGAGPADHLFAALQDVVMTGHLGGAQLARAVASADILVHPSRTEAFGNVVLEAMASGVAIVAAASGSSGALITDGRDGLLCDGDDLQAFADRVERLSRDPGERRCLGKAARSASSAFSWGSASNTVLGAYRGLVSEAHSRKCVMRHFQ